MQVVFIKYYPNSKIYVYQFQIILAYNYSEACKE